MYVGQFDQPPQSEGSALTYKRRYSLSAILGVASEEDDDGEEASKDKPETIKPKVEVNKSEHWCEKHQVNFRPNRNGGYGHYVGQTKEYCVEHTPKPEPAKEEIFPETDNEESPQSTEPPPVAASGQQTETVQKLTDFDKLMLAVRDVKKALRSDRNVIDWLSATLKVSADEVKADPVKAWLGIRDLIGKAGKEL
jgi:hypothetical protein